MNRWRLVTGLAMLGALVFGAGKVEAGRTVGMRTAGPRSNGVRSDITVPYLTTGRSAFMPNFVSPRIYTSPVVNDPKYPQAKPVFNLIFYGSQQGFGDYSNGAKPRTR